MNALKGDVLHSLQGIVVQRVGGSIGHLIKCHHVLLLVCPSGQYLLFLPLLDCF